MSRRHLESYPTHPMSPPPNAYTGTTSVLFEGVRNAYCSNAALTVSVNGTSRRHICGNEGELQLFNINTPIRTYNNIYNSQSIANVAGRYSTNWFSNDDLSRCFNYPSMSTGNKTVQITFAAAIFTWWPSGSWNVGYCPCGAVPTHTYSCPLENNTNEHTLTSPIFEYNVCADPGGTVIGVRMQYSFSYSLHNYYWISSDSSSEYAGKSGFVIYSMSIPVFELKGKFQGS